MNTQSSSQQPNNTTTQQPPKQTPQQPTKRPQSISISVASAQQQADSTRQSASESLQTEVAEKKNNPFSLEQLQETWVQAISAVAQDDERLKNTIRKHFPEVKNNTQLVLVLDNESQVTNMKKEEQKLIYFLRSSLQNDYITIEYSIQETEDDTPYTSEDKIKYFAQHNPDINTLINELKLQIE